MSHAHSLTFPVCHLMHVDRLVTLLFARALTKQLSDLVFAKHVSRTCLTWTPSTRVCHNGWGAGGESQRHWQRSSLKNNNHHGHWSWACSTNRQLEYRYKIWRSPRMSGWTFRSGTAIPVAGATTSKKSACTKQARTLKSTGPLQRDWLVAWREQHDELVWRWLPLSCRPQPETSLTTENERRQKPSGQSLDNNAHTEKVWKSRDVHRHEQAPEKTARACHGLHHEVWGGLQDSPWQWDQSVDDWQCATLDAG